MSGQLYMTDASYRRQIVPKKNILPPPPYLETPKDIATKSGESRVWGSTIMQLFTTIGMSLGKK